LSFCVLNYGIVLRLRLPVWLLLLPVLSPPVFWALTQGGYCHNNMAEF